MIGRAAWFAALFALAACRTPDRPPPQKEPLLYVDPAAYDFEKSPGLLERVTGTPFGYFRLINRTFSNEVCNRFNDDIVRMASVNLHGDAHLEQYAITDQGRGLTDFDDSASGPAVIDLVRFGASIYLASAQLGWEARAPQIFAAFLAGYREGINHPEGDAPIPQMVKSIQDGFEFDKQKFFEWIKSITEPVPPAIDAEIRGAMKPYVEAMVETDKSMSPQYFELQWIGQARIGIGSALDRKYLLRVRGETDDPGDDDILELKEVRDLSGVKCVEGQRRAPFRTLVAQARIAYQPSRLLGYVRLGADYFWVHAWVRNYRELSVAKLENPDDIAAIAKDVGIQLGRGHPRDIALPFSTQLRHETLQWVDQRAPQIEQAAKDLARETVLAWEEFKKRAPPLAHKDVQR